MSTLNKIFFVILATASLFSVAYMTGLVKETHYVTDSIIKPKQYDAECVQTQEKEYQEALENTPGYRKPLPGELPQLPSWNWPVRPSMENCLTENEVWGQTTCDYVLKRQRIEWCYGVTKFSPMKTGVLALVSLTGLMYFKIKRSK